MIVDEKRKKRQLEILNNWRINNGRGICEAATGFGKTYVSILLIQSMNNKFPERKTNIVIPSSKLYNDWTREIKDKDGRYGHIKEHNLKNIFVYIVNTYVKYDHDCTLLICDEIHHYANSESKTFSTVLSRTNYKHILGLTATLNNKEREFLLKNHNIPIIDTVTMYEAEENKWIAKSVIYNLGLILSDEDKEKYNIIHSRFNSLYSLFGHDFELAMACRVGNETVMKVGGIAKTGKSWRHWYANEKQWDGSNQHKWSISNIAKYARMFGQCMQERMNFLHNHPIKIDAIEKIVDKFKLQTIIFSQGKRFAEDITKRLGNNIAVTYHSSLSTEIRKNNELVAITQKVNNITYYYDINFKKLFSLAKIKEIYGKVTKIGKGKLRQEAIDKFQDKNNNVRILSTVKALDEGVDIKSIKVGIMAAYYSTPRQDIQRSGRPGRYEKNKTALIINLYIKGTQEERGWLKHKQKNTEKIIHWVDNIDDISIQTALEYNKVSLI